MTHEIELRRIVPNQTRKYVTRGARAIFVGGERWGELVPEPNGTHGTHYSFTDAHGSPVEHNAWKSRGRKSWDRRPIRVKSDKSEKRGHAFNDPVKPVMVRVVERIAQAIKDGDLKSPADLKRDSEAANKLFREIREQAADADQAAFNAKADEVLAAFVTSPIRMCEDLPGSDQMRALVVAALRWAQTQ